jgi:putative transposase
MGSVGGAWDKPHVRELFATLEYELLDRGRFASRAEGADGMLQLHRDWYNTVRLHSALGYRSPMAYEAEVKSIPPVA